MQRLIQQITQQLIDRLPDNDQYYRLDELRSWGFPGFMIERIQIELERNLAESMIIPKTDWANTQSDQVQDAWQQFVDAIRAEARLPASYAQTVIETAVADVVEMLVEPRKNIPNIVFGSHEYLDVKKVRSRMKLVVVYPHFAQLIPRYMQKKDLKKLSLERCQKVVARADNKITEQYSPLNWAQLLEPLFKLVGGELDTNLLRLFFEDKKMPRIARKFDLMNDALTRAEFIEVLSSPELLDFEGYEDDQSQLFDDQPAQDDEPEQKQGTEKQKNERSTEKADPDSGTDHESGSEDHETKSEEPSTEHGPVSEDEFDPTLNAGFMQQEQAAKAKETETNDNDSESPSLNSGFYEDPEQDDSAAAIDDEEDEGSLNAAFADLEEDTDSPDSADDSNREERSLSDEPESVSQEGVQSQEQDREAPAQPKRNQGQESRQPAEQETSEQDEVDTDTSRSEEGEAEDTPIWMRYMSDEEIEEYREKQEQDEPEEFEEDPIIDLTNEDAGDEEIDEIFELLESDRKMFVEDIFRGSERAYEQAVEDIAGYSSWRKVSKYIEKDIFKRNLVDMYDEAAVEFTDRLQTYFLEQQNQSK
jgi:hypothetical protein